MSFFCDCYDFKKMYTDITDDLLMLNLPLIVHFVTTISILMGFKLLLVS